MLLVAGPITSRIQAIQERLTYAILDLGCCSQDSPEVVYKMFLASFLHDFESLEAGFFLLPLCSV